MAAHILLAYLLYRRVLKRRYALTRAVSHARFHSPEECRCYLPSTWRNQ